MGGRSRPRRSRIARSTGQVCFCWYRIKITIPPEAEGKAVFFQTTVDDYGEIWVDGKLPRTPGKGGEAIVAGFNVPNRVELKDPKPGKVYQIAVFGINGPISAAPPTGSSSATPSSTSSTRSEWQHDSLETNLGRARSPSDSGKVRDVYDLGDRLLLVATDRISAFDWVMPNGIPDKGRVLTGLSAFWFEHLKVANHLISTDVDDAGLDLTPEERESLEGRVDAGAQGPRRAVRVRGAGLSWPAAPGRNTARPERSAASRCRPGWSRATGSSPIFTPATKAETGHDENVSFETMAGAVGKEVAETLQSMSLEVYRIAADHAAERGLILADTKFEWGFDDETGELLLVDEVLTPDSSRYWPGMRIAPAVRSRRSTSSSSATGSRRPAGTRRARRRGCPRTSWTRRATSTSRRSSA